MSRSKKGGQPTKYREEYCQKLIDHMAKGLSYESFAAIIGVHRDTLYEWEKKHDVFSDSKKIGLGKCLLFYETIGIQGMMGKIAGFNATTWIFKMKNRFGWATNGGEGEVEEKTFTLNYSLK